MHRLACLLIAIAGTQAHEPITTKLTWTQEISRIVYKHCVSCHREGGSAPMSLLGYDDARPWAKAIRDEVLERRMPPWGAVKGVGEFRDDPSLSLFEIGMIVNWVEGGAPNGDDIYLPPVPSFDSFAKRAENAKQADLVIDSKAALKLMASVSAVSITPRSLPDGGSMEVTACLPDGAVQRLIWLRNYRPRWNRTYLFREPVRLPKGTRIAVSSGEVIVSVAALARTQAGN
jgi:hypothetical protein